MNTNTVWWNTAKPNIVDGLTPFHEAAAQGSLMTKSSLDKDWLTPFHEAAAQGSLATKSTYSGKRLADSISWGCCSWDFDDKKSSG